MSGYILRLVSILASQDCPQARCTFLYPQSERLTLNFLNKSRTSWFFARDRVWLSLAKTKMTNIQHLCCFCTSSSILKAARVLSLCTSSRLYFRVQVIFFPLKKWCDEIFASSLSLIHFQSYSANFTLKAVQKFFLTPLVAACDETDPVVKSRLWLTRLDVTLN